MDMTTISDHSLPDAIADIAIIDVDTHVVEPPDLWTSRLPSKWHDLVPSVRWDETTQEEAWFLAGERGISIGSSAMAGWAEWPPNAPRRWTEVDPVMWDASRRARMMDEEGIAAQVLYPNVAVFGAKTILRLNPEVQLAIVRTYNDFLVEWGGVEPGRYVPIAMLPFWDVSLIADEMVRCAEMGHRGVIFTQDPTYFGLPNLSDHYWDPMWGQAQELGLSINFHIATAGLDVVSTFNRDDGKHGEQGTLGHLLLHGQLEDDRTAHHWRCLSSFPRPAVRVCRERHRLDSLLYRLARLAMEERWCRPRAPRVRPAPERVLQAPVLRVLLV